MMCWCCFVCTTLGSLSGEVALSNIFARAINASFCEFPSVTSGLSGAGFCIALIKSCSGRMPSSVDEIFGMINFMGKKYPVFEIRSALFLWMYALWDL